MRSYNRFSTDETVAVTTLKTSGEAALYNLSSGGCMIELDDADAAVGEQLSITLKPGLEMIGDIVWRVSKNAGIKFAQPLHTSVVETFGYDEAEEFDDEDPRDRFGIPLIQKRRNAAGTME